ncbi:hypothetical protein DPPLL_20520 [Desulfofustis limnaeus]|uniref:Uncharacterized protein n=1 Tax=Desulfofustis limnaeus TaxID=2740163 RepID=A0ABM7W9P4_9BACT|nr:hypothetical protein DPPLL_20520 [Desulfofustis limnaeus]
MRYGPAFGIACEGIAIILFDVILICYKLINKFNRFYILYVKISDSVLKVWAISAPIQVIF